MLAEMGNRDVGAFVCKGDRGRPPDPGIGCSNQHDALLQFAASAVGMLAVIRCGS